MDLKIAVGVSVCGHETYYKCAKIGLKSFLDNCKTAHLIIFTERIEEFYSWLEIYPNLTVLDFGRSLEKYRSRLNSLEDKLVNNGKPFEYFDYIHKSIYASALMPMVQFYADEIGKFDWLGKIDADGYFVGDIYKLWEEECGVWAWKKDFFVVERSHPEMECFDMSGAVGGGFCLWRRNSRFMERYILLFERNDNNTIWNCMGDRQVLRPCILLRPGYHFVYPFRININFSKEDALRFVPAYFHCGGNDIVGQMKKMEGWFKCVE